MTSGGLLLAVWLTPVFWFQIPALIAGQGPDGLWVGLALVLVPLIALGARAPEPAAGRAEPVFSLAVLLLTVWILLWANLILAGDIAAWLGEPRWHGIAAAAGGAAVLTAWRGGRRLVPLLLLAAVLAVAAPLAEVARAAGIGPLGAWSHVATQIAFRFPAASPWVAGGRDLGLVRAPAQIVFDEEHRLTAPAGARILARTRDGGHSSDVEVTLSPGQSVTLRSGDLLRAGSSGRLRFEADKRVPGSPRSGIAWAEGRRWGWLERAGLLTTLLFGALALCHMGPAAPATRPAVAVVALGGLALLLWSQGWAVYSLLASPDLFLGGVAAERFLVLPPIGAADEWRRALQISLLAGGLAAFLASSIALRERLGALDRTGGGEIAHDLGLWTGVFAIAGLASLWPANGWSLVVLALGAAASSVGATAIGLRPAASGGVRAFAGFAGLAAFVALALAAELRASPEGWVGALLAYPALVAVPFAGIVLRAARALVG